MDSLAEERASELEALQSIFDEDFHLLDAEDDLEAFEIDIRSREVPTGPDGSAEVVSCCLHFEYTTEYPNSAPQFALMDTQNLADEDLDEIRALIDSQCEENLGMVMIFTVVSAVQEKLQDVAEHLEEHRRLAEERKRKQQEEDEKRKFVGTPVTLETFREWRTQFEAELTQSRARRLKEKEAAGKKQTGKELFMADNRFDISDLQILQDEGGEAVEVDESLFQNLDDLDLLDE